MTYQLLDPTFGLMIDIVNGFKVVQNFESAQEPIRELLKDHQHFYEWGVLIFLILTNIFLSGFFQANKNIKDYTLYLQLIFLFFLIYEISIIKTWPLIKRGQRTSSIYFKKSTVLHPPSNIKGAMIWPPVLAAIRLEPALKIVLML